MMTRHHGLFAAALFLAASCASPKVGERVPVAGISGLERVEFACFGME